MNPLAVWKQVLSLDTRGMAFFGGSSLVGAAATTFGMKSSYIFVSNFSFTAFISFAFLGLAAFVISLYKEFVVPENITTVIGIISYSSLVAIGILLLAMAEDPTPFISTLVASIISLGVSWWFFFLGRESGIKETEKKQASMLRRLDDYHDDVQELGRAK